MISSRNKLILGYLCGIGAALFWGFHAVFIRILIKDGIDPFLIASLRLFIGAAILFVITLISSVVSRKQYPKVSHSRFFWLISLCLGVNFLLFQKGLEFTIASDAVLLEAFSPVMVLIIIMFFLPDRINHLLIHPGLPQKIFRILIIGSIGSSLLLLNDPQDIFIQNNMKLAGNIIEFIAMIIWAFVMIGIHEYRQREKESSILASTAQFLLCAAIITVPFAAWQQVFSLTASQWFLIFLFGILSTGGAYVLWHVASKYLDVLPLVTIFNLVSIFTIITESIVLGLAISWKLFLGGALILYAAMMAKMINAKYKIIKSEGMSSE